METSLPLTPNVTVVTIALFCGVSSITSSSNRFMSAIDSVRVAGPSARTASSTRILRLLLGSISRKVSRAPSFAPPITRNCCPTANVVFVVQSIAVLLSMWLCVIVHVDDPQVTV